jgi:hypothetical protein
MKSCSSSKSASVDSSGGSSQGTPAPDEMKKRAMELERRKAAKEKLARWKVRSIRRIIIACRGLVAVLGFFYLFFFFSLNRIKATRSSARRAGSALMRFECIAN